MNKAIEENLKKCVLIYAQTIEERLKHPDDDDYAMMESQAFTMLYNAIKDDVMEKHTQSILDDLYGVLPF